MKVNSVAARAAIGLASAVLTTMAIVPAAHAEPQYIEQATVTYGYTVPFGSVSEFCTGKAFIGQLSTNQIEAYSESICTGFMLFNSTETWIRPEPNTLESLANNMSTCSLGPSEPCTSVTAATSIPGGPPGTQYCVTGFGNASTGEDHLGSGGVCITTR